MIFDEFMLFEYHHQGWVVNKFTDSYIIANKAP